MMDIPMRDYARQSTFAKTRYGYCDSYFIESHDDQERRLREEKRERERQFKRQIQVTKAEDLSRLASEEYRADHLQQMEIMEVRSSSNPIAFVFTNLI